jgi:riboflavin kinase / FMN adenylyltransferase
VQVLLDDDPHWPPTQRSVVTIGAYDGLHDGHRAVIDLVRSEAIQRNATSVVVTFDRHPALVVRPESAPKLLTDPVQRLELLESTGVDATYLIHFDERRAEESPEDFIREVLVDRLHASAVVIGEDFHFGHHRSGDVTMLRQLGARYGFEVLPLELQMRDDGPQEPVSSTAIRRALAGGQVELAAAMLGRPYEVRGIVAQGDQRGRTLGFPTANVMVPDVMCLPADGVYAGWYQRPSGSRHRCAVNIGRRPTFYEHADVSLLEAHLIDFDGDLYGENARVEFDAFLRSERKFNGIDALISQLKSDVEAARMID